MRANGVRIRNAVGTAGDNEAARGCGVVLTIGAAACVGKGWESASQTVEGWEEGVGELESLKI
jgi:hypothetical protein